MMEDDPDYGYYYETEPTERVPISFHVVFFDKDVSRAWVNSYSVRGFSANEDPEDIGQIVIRKKNYKKQLDQAAAQAREALALPLEERLAVYGFEKRFEGAVGHKAKKTKRVVIKEDLPDSIESSEELLSSGTSYSSSQEKNQKNPKKKTAKIAADKKAALTTKPVAKASDKGKAFADGNGSTSKDKTKPSGDSSTAKGKTKPSGDGSTTKKLKDSETEKKTKKPGTWLIPVDSKSQETLDKSENSNTESTSTEEAYSDDKTTQALCEDGAQNLVTSKAKKAEKEKAPKKGRKRKTEQNPSADASTAEINEETEKPKKKRPACGVKAPKKKSQGEEGVSSTADTVNNQQNVKEKKPKQMVDKDKKKGFKKMTKNQDDETKTSLAEDHQNKNVNDKTSTTHSSKIKKKNAVASEPSTSPAKTSAITTKPLPKLVKPSFKPQSKTKASHPGEAKPRKMPKLVKPQFVSPAIANADKMAKEEPKATVKNTESQSPKVIVEHLEPERSNEEEESSQPLAIKKARKSAVKRVFESDDEQDIADEMEAELAKLDQDIEEMRRTFSDSNDTADEQDDEELDIDDMMPTDNTKNPQPVAKTMVSTQDSPEF